VGLAVRVLRSWLGLTPPHSPDATGSPLTGKRASDFRPHRHEPVPFPSPHYLCNTYRCISVVRVNPDFPENPLPAPGLGRRPLEQDDGSGSEGNEASRSEGGGSDSKVDSVAAAAAAVEAQGAAAAVRRCAEALWPEVSVGCRSVGLTALDEVDRRMNLL